MPAEHIQLNQLRAGEGVRIAFDTQETQTLITRLQQVLAASGAGPVQGVNEWRVVREGTLVIEGEQAGILAALLRDYGNDRLFELLADLRPGLSEWVAHKHVFERRRDAVATFEHHLDAGDWREHDWQLFFDQHTWMFGVGLRYVFLGLEQSRPTLGGRSVTGRGGVEGDFLASTVGQIRFTVLVELKTPAAALVKTTSYRNRAHVPGDDVVGGVAQVQAQCAAWERSATVLENDQVDAVTVQPRGLLVVGNLSSLGSPDQVRAFERFRRNVVNPEIITFDELLERARFVLGEAAESIPVAATASDPGIDPDDLPC